MALKQPVVWITGASSGLGLYTAQALRDAGFLVISGARSFKDSAQTEDGIHRLPLDVTSDESAAAFCEAALRISPRVDALVNCAGVFPQALIEDITYEDWSRVMRINLDGAFYACRAAAPYLKKSGTTGRIINLSSQAALNGTAHGVHYGASKAALLGLTYCLAKELGPDGITVNAILPGRIDTEMLAYATPERRAQWLQSTPLGRFGDTADIAELAVFLASDKGGYITGAKINVNGGLSTG